ncbi:MAG: 16S rRNA (cytidine(1402)-2'-O)-methyltransferase [Synergistaceae bacterium]|jgi:16S rRNA (cytidine1402-2'-O)-methyltransferase|nr:16S rRNA (cytidine(1402)-2'-O)-methyltransferase [Synergistaceae bacterium]
MPLTLVPTPIGNLEDITLRALRVLKEADLIACEDTRTSSVLLKRYHIVKPLISLHRYNEKERTARLVAALGEGKRVAVISDAGTPGISDPGFLLLQAARSAGFEVDVLPGPSALLPAVLLSGLPPHPFVFCGFPPEKPGARKKFFASLAPLSYTLIFYVSPHKADRQLAGMIESWGDRPAALVREISKVYQEAVRGTLSGIAARLEEGLKGEMVLVVAGKEQDASDDWRERARELRAGGRFAREIAEEIAELYNVPKNAVKEFLMNDRQP